MDQSGPELQWIRVALKFNGSGWIRTSMDQSGSEIQWIRLDQILQWITGSENQCLDQNAGERPRSQPTAQSHPQGGFEPGSQCFKKSNFPVPKPFLFKGSAPKRAKLSVFKNAPNLPGWREETLPTGGLRQPSQGDICTRAQSHIWIERPQHKQQVLTGIERNLGQKWSKLLTVCFVSKGPQLSWTSAWSQRRNHMFHVLMEAKSATLLPTQSCNVSRRWCTLQLHSLQPNPPCHSNQSYKHKPLRITKKTSGEIRGVVWQNSSHNMRIVPGGRYLVGSSDTRWAMLLSTYLGQF